MVTVCGSLSLLVQVTMVPGLMKMTMGTIVSEVISTDAWFSVVAAPVKVHEERITISARIDHLMNYGERNLVNNLYGLYGCSYGEKFCADCDHPRARPSPSASTYLTM